MQAADLLRLAIQANAIMANGRELLGFIHRQAAMMQADGQLDDAQRDAIRQAAGESEAEWDQRVAEARARLGDGT